MSTLHPDHCPYYPPTAAQRYIDAGLWHAETFAEFFASRCATFATHTALIGPDATGGHHRLSYTDLHHYGLQVAAEYAASGVRPGDVVILRLPNSVEFLGAVVGCAYAGAIPLFSLPAHGQQEVGSFVQLLTAQGMRAHIATVGRFPLLTPLPGEVYQNAPQILIPAPSPTAPVAQMHDDTHTSAGSLGLLQCSGGTTGTPKLIPRSHADYLYSVRASAEICALTTQDVLLQVLPAAHNFSMSSPGILGVLHAGGTVVMQPDPTPLSSFKLIAQEGVTLTALVPPLLLTWLNSAHLHGHSFASLRLMLVGGAKLPEEAAVRVEPAFRCTLMQVFGMAEGLVNYTRLDDPEHIRLVSQGRPISTFDEVRVLDDAGHPVPDGTPGNLWTRGPYTIRGYLGGVGADSFSDDGFYRSGDIVTRLPTGHLVVSGRAKDQINRAGEKIVPEEVENHLLALDGVDDAVVIGVPDDQLGERTVAYLLSPRGDITLGLVREHLRDRGLAAYKLPDHVQVVAQFPHTAVGKISRKQLRHEVAAAHATQAP